MGLGRMLLNFIICYLWDSKPENKFVFSLETNFIQKDKRISNEISLPWPIHKEVAISHISKPLWYINIEKKPIQLRIANESLYHCMLKLPNYPVRKTKWLTLFKISYRKWDYFVDERVVGHQFSTEAYTCD